MKDYAMKMSAFAVIALMLAVVAVPVVDASVDEPEQEAVDLPIYESGFWEDYIVTPVTFTALWVVNGLKNLLGLNGDPTNDDNAGDNEQIKEQFRELEAEKIETALNTMMGIINSVLPSDVDLWFFTSDYWQKNIEYNAADLWRLNGDFDDYANRLMGLSGLATNASTSLYNWQVAVDDAMNSVVDYSLKFSADEMYSSMSFMVQYGSHTLSQGTAPTEDDRLILDLTQFAFPSAGRTQVYIDTTLADVSPDKQYCNTLYVFGADANETVSIVDVETGARYNLSPGANDINAMNLVSGIYDVPEGIVLAGHITPLSTDYSAEVRGGLVFAKGDSMMYAIPADEDDSNTDLNIYNHTGKLLEKVSSLGLRINYDGPEGISNKTVNLVGSRTYEDDGGNDVVVTFDLIGQYDALVRQISTVAKNTYETGKATWMIFDTAEESNQYVRPSSISINAPGHQLTAEEYQAIYVLVMSEIVDYYINNSEDFDGISFYTDSLGLVCYGDIYKNGTLWVENAVFTPYNSEDQILETGDMVDWVGEGFAVIWAVKVDDFDAWKETDGNMSMSNSYYMDLSTDFKIDLKHMEEEGTVITYKDLSLNKINVYDPPDIPDPIPDPTPEEELEVLDAQIMMLLILVELGFIIILLGLITQITPLLWVGIIVIIFGLLWPQVVTSLLLDNFVWADLMPLGWI